ncbi:Endoglucanase E1 [Thalassocella blandensis]|nr:Endoglucanase E1 [Thalassocella blandensis]
MKNLKKMKSTIFSTLLCTLFFIASPQSFASECTELFPLSTKGRYVIDACQNRFKLKSVNWYGASGSREVVGGLQHQTMQHIVNVIKDSGFNSVRLPFSNQMLHTTSAVPNEYLTANPQLFGKTPLQVYDAVVEALAEKNIAIILNNHTSFSEWCCGFDFNGLWYHDGQSKAQWQQDWLNLVGRYQHIPQVVGADLRNEVRTTKWHNTVFPESPNWGWGDKNDWKMIAQETGNKINKLDGDLLIIVEGINWWGSLPILGSGERPHLMPAKHDPINLIKANKLVYAAHNYGFIGPNHNGSDETSAGNIKYSDMDRETLFHKLEEEFAFITDPFQAYTAPVWISEFGIGYNESAEHYRRWFINFTEFMVMHDLDFAYWPLNPEKGDGAHDTYTLMENDWSRMRNDWRTPYMQQLINQDAATGAVEDFSAEFSLVRFENHDNNVADLNYDWDSGAMKGSCRNGDRVLGFSSNETILCSHSQTGNLLADHQEFYTRNNEVGSPRGKDWAGGFTKYECDKNFYVAGISKRWWGTSGVLCAKANRELGNACSTLWFDQGDNRQSNTGNDWSPGALKGQCGDDKYLAGVAQRDGEQAALLCCGLAKNEVVTLYQHCDKNGYAIELAPGRYTLSDLQALGMANDDISSLSVQSGFKVEMYQHHDFTGNVITKSADDNCLGDDGFNDDLSSVIVSPR